MNSDPSAKNPLTYFVTGGSRGLGAGIVAQALAEGHDVAFSYVNNKEAADGVVRQARASRPDRRCKAYRLDVSRSAEVETVIDRVLDDFDHIDVLVNNAGINRNNLVASMTDEEWEEVIRTNLSGPFYVCRQVLPTMLSRRFGRIINISSIQIDGGSGAANYAASKSGLHGFTRSLAKEYGRRGINSNVVVPGFFETDMTQETMAPQLKEFWNMFCPVPGGRMGKSHELARVVTFLASEGADYINGQVIHVTGGLDTSI